MTVQDFLNQFKTPDPRFGPVPAWWWSGDKLDWPRMRWQMDQMHAMGIRNLVIINLAPGGTLFGSEPDDPPFLSEAWWGFFEKTCDRARELDMKIWFYDQIGFSGANFQADLVAAHPELSAEQLKRVSVEGIGTLSLECPGAGTPIAAYVTGAGSPTADRYIPLTGRRATVEVSSASKLTIVFSVKQGFDYLSPAACQKLLDTVHRQFERRLPKHIGTTIVGSFQDELPEVPTWGPTFARTFKQEHGYDLTEVIHRLFEPGDDQSRLTRVQYHNHRASLGEAAFFKPFFEWHESLGLTCGFDQQSPAREARILGCTSKYADYMRVHQWYGAPGCDLHGNGKLHSSIAFLHDRKRVWLEGFHSTGWGGTIADTFDWLMPYLQSGSNLYNPHAIYYGTKQGWWEWAPPSTCWRQPYARHYKPFAEMIARLCKLLTVGVHQATVGVLFPTATVQSAVGPVDTFPDAKAADQTLHEVIGSMRWHQVKTGPLNEMAIDYHLLDEPAVASATVDEATLTIHTVPLRAIVLPHVTMLDAATWEKLKRFAEAGGKVVAVGSHRALVAGGVGGDFASLPNAVVVDHADKLKEVLKDVSPQIAAPAPFMHRRVGEMDLLFVPAVNGMATVVKWPGWFEPIEHTTIVHDRYAATAKVELPAEVKAIYRFDPVDGSIAPVAERLPTVSPSSDGKRDTAKRVCAAGRTVEIDFEGAPFVVLVASRVEPPAAVESAEGESQSLKLAEDWNCEYVPTLPTEFIDTHDPARPELRLPRTEELKWVTDDSGDHHAGLPDSTDRVRTGFGPRGWKVSGDGAPEPIVYSPDFGIAQDKLHINTLGPKGHVPEEFIDLGKLTAGAPVTVRFGVVSEVERDALLIVGANARKSAAVNGKVVGAFGDRYQDMVPVRLVRGENAIAVTLSVDKDAAVRMYWCLADVAGELACTRPERILAPDAPSFGTQLVYSTRFHTSDAIVSGKVKVSVAALARVFIDDHPLGLQGGCDPYRPMTRGNIYELPQLPAGEHTVRVEILDPGGRAALHVDLLAHEQGGRPVIVVSDESWKVRRDRGPLNDVIVHLKPDADNAAWSLYRRPHPLPRTRWIEGESSPVVLDLPLVPPSPQARVQWFEWLIPPGAWAMRLPLVGVSSAGLWVDGEVAEVPPRASPSGANVCDVLLTRSASIARKAVLRIESQQLGGSVFTGPITYELGDGTLRTGSWLDQGLRSYSGAVRLKQTIQLPADSIGRKLTLDLGRVRGTVEAIINGRCVGVRFMSPYKFDLSSGAREGANDLELLVTNTLVNHLSHWSPSRWWSPDQLECGVMGPVALRWE